jgi:hypothetical protein
VLLGPLSGPGALVLVAVLLARGARREPTQRPRGLRTVTGRACGAARWPSTSGELRAGLVMRYPKGVPRPDDEVTVFERWNPISHVRLRDFADTPVPLLVVALAA